jgi:antitoxin component YwqK of YwqJK toxin-antitoxin module
VVAALLLALQDAYAIADVPVPADVVLEVGGIEILPDGRPIVCTRRGQVWIVESCVFEAGAQTHTIGCTLFADGLQEPLGLLAHDGWVYAIQRGELSRMRDVDGDDRMDELETVGDPWSISGNYHEYAFGPALADDGSLWVTLNKPFGDEPFGRVDWRGFALQLWPDGAWQPMCSGLRSPCGIGKSPEGELFYTDNQGEWCGAGKLALLRPGSCHGHPWGLFSCARPEWAFGAPGEPPNGVLMPRVHESVPSFELPAVWFPYDKTGRSPAGFAWDETGGKFGPFAGQMFVGDQYAASLNRVFLERVNGRVQGAVFPFLKGLASGVTRVKFAPDGSLLVGMTDRGWTALGTRAHGLQRVAWTGATPFEIRAMRARADGFELELTSDVDPTTAADPASYTLKSYTYELHASYGSDEMDVRELGVRAVELGADRRTVRLRVDGLRSGYVHELRAGGLRAADGGPLDHADAYYTLIAIPEAGGVATRDVDERFDDGKLKRAGRERQASDGIWVPIGAWREGAYQEDYYGDGEYELSTGDYADGERAGLWTARDADGNVVRRGRYAAGREDGEWTWFDAGGRASIAGRYAHGVQVGTWRWWHANGARYKQGAFDAAGRDQGTWRWWYESGALAREGGYVDGAAGGLWREWHENGRIASEGAYLPEPAPVEPGAPRAIHGDDVRRSHRDGPWRTWWPNGQLRQEGGWKAGQPVEPHRHWRSDGTPSDGPARDE